MARIARVVAPGLPHHITQRENRRQPTFFGTSRSIPSGWASRGSHGSLPGAAPRPTWRGKWRARWAGHSGQAPQAGREQDHGNESGIPGIPTQFFIYWLMCRSAIVTSLPSRMRFTST